MNYHNITIVSGCVGLLTVFLMCVFTNYQFQLLSSKMSNEYIKDIINDFSDTGNFSSSIWCNKRFDGSKLCKFNNLYYFPEFKDNFLFLMTEFSVVSGVEDLKKLSLSTVQNHSIVNMKLIIIKSSEYFLNKNISVLEKNAFLMRSFKSDNIMHVIHDDLLPLFVTYKELCFGDIYLCVSSYHLIIIDNNTHRPYFQWYMQFSANRPTIITIEKYPLCIRKGYFGLSNSSIWFQYGFKNNQGPLINHINIVFLMEFSEYMKQRFGVTKEVNSKRVKKIVFFSRKINRRLLNEKQMEEKMVNIAQTFFEEDIILETLDISTNSSNIIIHSLHNSQLLVGIHGSAMILALFMPPGSRIVELFPFGIQPEFVSPLRALCKLQNIYYHYDSWINRNESNTRTHPEYPPLLGGVFHLEDSEQNRIKNIKKVPAVECCHEPVYLFRMYQDTIVDDSFYKLFHKVVSSYIGSHNMSKGEVMMKNLEQNLKKWYFPPPVFNLTCQYFGDKFKVTWDYPFTSQGIEFSIATSNGLLAVTKQTNFLITTEECYSKCTQGQSVSVWVKSIDGVQDSLDSFVRCIATKPN